MRHAFSTHTSRVSSFARQKRALARISFIEFSAFNITVRDNSAWFLTHRIREAFRSGELAPLGGGGGIVEVDETFIVKKMICRSAAALRTNTRSCRLSSAAARFVRSM
jgi:hypothetical protein